MKLSFDACFPSFSLAERPPRDLQISVLLQIIFCSCVIETTVADRFPELSETDLTSLVDLKNSENTEKATVIEKNIKQLLNSVIAKYRDLSMSRN